MDLRITEGVEKLPYHQPFFYTFHAIELCEYLSNAVINLLQGWAHLQKSVSQRSCELIPWVKGGGVKKENVRVGLRKPMTNGSVTSAGTVIEPVGGWGMATWGKEGREGEE